MSATLGLHCTMLPGGLGFAKLVGVRDLVWSAHRMQTSTESLSLLEQDMSDMFWEIPGEEALQAVSWAVGECKKKLRGKTLWFSLSKEAKCLDRLGKSADCQFIVVNDDHLTMFGRNVPWASQPTVPGELGRNFSA